jgi:predicted dehydrogenase
MMGFVGAVALRRDPAWIVVAIADTSPEARARTQTVLPDVDAFDDAHDLVDRAQLDRLEIDAVFVMTPPASHETLSIAALDAGRHVVCEKPMARTPAECRRMVNAVGGPSIAVIDHQLRYNRARRHILDQLTRGAFGVPIHVDVTATFPSLATTPWTWWSSLAQGGGLLNEYGSHTTDLLHWWFGRSASATGTVRTAVRERRTGDGAARGVDSDDVASFRLDWNDGLFADVRLSGAAHRSDRTITIHTTELTAILDAHDHLHLHRRDGETSIVELEELESSLIGDPTETYTQPFARLITDLAASIGRGEQPEQAATFTDGETVVTRLQQVRESSPPRATALETA